MLADCHERPPVQDEATVARGIGRLEPERDDGRALGERRAHAAQGIGLDERRVAEHDEHVVVTLGDDVARGEHGVRRAAALGLQRDGGVGAHVPDFGGDVVAAGADDHGDVIRLRLREAGQHVGEHRASADRVQHLRNGRPHSCALPGGEHDGETAAAGFGHRRRNPLVMAANPLP